MKCYLLTSIAAIVVLFCMLSWSRADDTELHDLVRTYQAVSDHKVKLYVVILKPDHALDTFGPHLQVRLAAHNSARQQLANYIESRIADEANPEVCAELGEMRAELGRHYTYDIGDFFGYAVHMTSALAAELAMHPAVKYVSLDQPIYGSDIMMQPVAKRDTNDCPPVSLASNPNPGTWALTRICNRDCNHGMLGPYNYPASGGQGVDVYIVDGGINVEHDEFEGRARVVQNFVLSEGFDDLGGHGTHVSALIGGKTYGVAPKCNLLGVKVLDQSRGGSMATIINGINWAVNNILANDKALSSLINLSMQGAFYPAMDDAVRAAFNKGVPIVTSAGNYGDSSCLHSPSAQSAAFTVGSIDQNDTRAYFSGYGKCTNVFAPGVDILSAYSGNTQATAVASGTSMSSAIVTGVMALFLGERPYNSVQDLFDAVSRAATQDKIAFDKNTGAKSPNKIVFNSPC